MRSKRCAPPDESPCYHPNPPTLTALKFGTCHLPKFEHNFAYIICKDKISVISNTCKPQKPFHAIDDRNRCDQYWDAARTMGKNVTYGSVKMHIKTLDYLQIETEVT